MNKISGVGVCIFLCMALNISTRAATFTVTSSADSGAGTLRQAILDANASAGTPDTINFNIAPAGAKTITPALASGPLPTITDAVTIDGTTQPGFVDKPIIEIAGNLVTTAGTDGLKISAGDCVIRGLVLNRWRGDAIEITVREYRGRCILGLNRRVLPGSRIT